MRDEPHSFVVVTDHWEDAEADARWDALFVQSQDMLAALADEALAEFAAGRTEPLDPDKL